MLSRYYGLLSGFEWLFGLEGICGGFVILSWGSLGIFLSVCEIVGGSLVVIVGGGQVWMVRCGKESERKYSIM